MCYSFTYNMFKQYLKVQTYANHLDCLKNGLYASDCSGKYCYTGLIHKSQWLIWYCISSNTCLFPNTFNYFPYNSIILLRSINRTLSSTSFVNTYIIGYRGLASSINISRWYYRNFSWADEHNEWLIPIQHTIP